MVRKSLALIVLVVASGVCAAQTNTAGQQRPAPKEADKPTTVDYVIPGNQIYLQRPQPELPKGNGVWAVTLETSGGLIESVKSITLTSRGHVTIDDPNGACSYDVEGGFPEIGRLIGEANEAGWSDEVLQPALTSLCRDCQSKKLVLNGRSANGTAYGHWAYWDDTTLANLKKEVVALYRALEKIKRECPQIKG
jgi:hypothetical protein